MRSGLRSPCAAPVRLSTSSSIRRCAAKPTISRSKSASELFSSSVRRLIISSVIVGSLVRVEVQRHFVARISSRANSAPGIPLSREANVLRPPQLQHAVQRGDSNGHLGRLPPFGPRAQHVTNHSLVATDIGLHQGTPIVTRCPLPAHAT